MINRIKLQRNLKKQLEVVIEKVLRDVELQDSRLADRVEIEAKFNDELIAQIMLPDYAVFIDRGRKAGSTPPPVSAIQAWMKRKGIAEGNLSVAYAIAKSIGQKGIQPRPFLNRLETDANAVVVAFLSSILSRVNVELFNKTKQI